MRKLIFNAVIAVALFGMVISCSNDDDTPTNQVTKKAVIENYAKMVYQNYKDSYDAAVKLQTKITAFTTSPSAATLQAAKDEWLAARESYGQSEVFRGSNGPIDTESDDAWAINNEGMLNAWPLNEAYIDYVADKTSYTGTYDVSIIDGTEVITEDLLATKNEAGGSDEKAVSTGWHAIEFLLWGQDNTNPSEKKAGQRPVEDYTTNENADRRKTYLNVVTSLLVKDLKQLVDTWAPNSTYYNVFMALPENTALTNMLNGPFFLASNELSNERMLVPAVGTDGIDGSGQEDEHSCFSDNTHRDVVTNAQGIVNVLQGSYGSIKGASFIALLKQTDAAQATKLEAAITKMQAAIKTIDDKAKSGTPFDLMIMQEGAANPGIVLEGDKVLKELGNVIKESASKLGITTTVK